MATTTKKKKANKKYYEKHKQEIIERVQKEQKTNRTEYNKDKREYYHKNEDYREYKKNMLRSIARKNLLNLLLEKTEKQLKRNREVLKKC